MSCTFLLIPLVVYRTHESRRISKGTTSHEKILLQMKDLIEQASKKIE